MRKNNLKIKKFTLGKYGLNSYLVHDFNYAILIDCPFENEEIISYILDNNLTLLKVLITHGHFDHVEGVASMLNNFKNAKLYANSLDKNWLIGNYNSRYNVFIDQIDTYIDISNLEEISFSSYTIKIIKTPGHTKGSVCYLLDDMLFTGDTLFKEAIGRCDLEEGNFIKIIKSLKYLYSLKKDLKVYPGHGESSSLFHEIKFNPFNTYLKK